jgi:hypothetical protein
MFTKTTFAIVAAALMTAAAHAAWTPFTPEGGRCRIAFPVEPKLQTVPADPAANRAELFVWTADDSNASASYALMWNDYVGNTAAAAKVISFDQKQDALAKARDSWGETTNGKLLSDRKLKLGEHAGRDCLFELAGQKLMRVQLFLVNDRLYQLGAQGPRELIQGGDADEFFKAFRLLRK